MWLTRRVSRDGRLRRLRPQGPWGLRAKRIRSNGRDIVLCGNVNEVVGGGARLDIGEHIL